MKFSELLVRADDETLQKIVGQRAVAVLVALNPDLAKSSRLREIIAQLHDEPDLFRDPERRSMLLSLLRRDEAEMLAVLLDTTASDIFSGLSQTKLRKNSSRERILFDFFELDYETVVSKETYDSRTTISPKFGLFQHQRTAASHCQDFLRSPEPRVLLHMPTGAGKTRTAMHIIADHLRNHAKTTVIWLAYSEELCGQAAAEFESAWHHMGDRSIELGRFWGDSDFSDAGSFEDGLIVASLSKIYQRATRDGEFITKIAEKTSLVVIDEAHQAVADTYSAVLEYLVGGTNSTGLLGLTATPGRTWDDMDADEKLAEFFKKQKVTLKIPGYDNPVDYLIDEGYLARPNFESLEYEPSQSLSPHQVDRLAEDLDVPVSILKQLADDVQRNLVITSAVEELIRRQHLRIIVFAATVDHARLLSTIFLARGIDSGSITGSSSINDRRRLIARFRKRSDRPMVLCNYGVLTAGFDAPETSSAVIARPTKSLVLYSQMVGRATRGTRAGGNDSADVLTIVDTQLPGFGDMSEAFTNWEDVWE